MGSSIEESKEDSSQGDNRVRILLPEEPIGYQVIGENTVEYGGRYTFKVILLEGYTQSSITVSVNGDVIGGANGVYIVESARQDLTITVDGVCLNLYKVSLPNGLGYQASGAATVTHGGTYVFTIRITEGFHKTEAFKVEVNGKEITSETDTYTLTATEDIQITVSGVKFGDKNETPIIPL